MTVDFAPDATLGQLARRATALARVRAFFHERDVMEVDVPALVNAPVTDVNIHSAEVRLPGDAARRFALHTSPEYAMKRLLAAGSGDIYWVEHLQENWMPIITIAAPTPRAFSSAWFREVRSSCSSSRAESPGSGRGGTFSSML